MKLNSLVNKVTGYINNKVEEKKVYDQRVNNSLKLNVSNVITDKDNNNEGYIIEFKEMCPYINETHARRIANLISLNEIVLNIVQINQKIDNQSFIMVLTNLRILIIKDDKYGAAKYTDITRFEIISKSLLSQIIDFNGIILGVDLNQNDFNIFYNLLFNVEYRNSFIVNKKKYLCGIEPIYQIFNKFNSGISIDSSDNIVFHERKEKNYLCKYQDIVNYEVLEDSTPVIKRRVNNNDNHSIPFTKKECVKISLRITLNNGQVFEIPILEPTAFNSVYSHTDKNYLKHIALAKEIMDKLDSLNKDLWK